MSAIDTVLFGAWVDYAALGTGGASYGGGGTFAGSAGATFESNIGRQCSLMHISGRWMDSGVLHPFSNYLAVYNDLAQTGRMPFVEWNPWDLTTPSNDYSLRPAAIAAGVWDSFITTWATDAKAWDKPLLIRLFVEPNLIGQYPWQYGSDTGQTVTFGNTWVNTLADVTAAWIRIVNIFRYTVGCPKVQFVWCPNIRGTTGGTSLLTYAQQWPGTDHTGKPWVDCIGVDGYAYEPDMSLGQVLRGTPNFTNGNSTGYLDSYAELIALDPSLPLMLCETGINGCGPANPAIAIASIVANGTTWTLTTATAPATTWRVTNGVTIKGSVAATIRGGFNGQFTIASVVNSTTITIANTTRPGTLTTPGTAQHVDRIARAAAIQQSVIDLRSMDRFKAVSFFWTAYDATQWTMDWDGSQPNNVDMLAFKAAMNSHFLVGNQMGLDLSARTWIPYQDQPVSTPNERYTAVLRSSRGLVGLWLLNDPPGATILDSSGGGHNGVVNASATLGNGNVVLAEPTWTSAAFPGVAGSSMSVANAAAWSPSATGHFTLEFSWYASSVPSAAAVLVSKYNAGNFEYRFYLDTTSRYNMAFNQLNGTTYASMSHAVPGSFVGWHHAIFCVDTTNSAVPFVGYVDGVSVGGSSAATGSMGTGTAPLMFGQSADNTLPMPAGWLLGAVALYNTTLPADDALDHFAAWNSAPVISGTASTPGAGLATITWTTDIPASSMVEYGLTTAYTNLSPYSALRVTNHSVTIAGLAPTTYHYRPRSRNVPGTERVDTDHSVLVGSPAQIRHWLS